MGGEVFSLEYLHYDGTVPLETVIAATENFVAPILSLYPKAQRGVMFDDIHTDMGFGAFIKGVRDLPFAPQSVYGESEFQPYMKELVKALEASGFYPYGRRLPALCR